MSAREMLEAAGRVLLPLLPFTVLAGDARVLLLVLPVGHLKNSSCDTGIVTGRFKF